MSDEAFQQRIMERLDRIEAIVTAGTPAVLCSLKEAARILGYSTTTVRERWVTTGELKHRVGKRFARADVMRLKRRLEGRDF